MDSPFIVRTAALLVSVLLTLQGRASVDAHRHPRRLMSSETQMVEFEGAEYPVSKYTNGEKPDSDCSQYPDQNYNFIAALNLGCKPKDGQDPIKIHKGDDVPGCTGGYENPYDCPKTYDGSFDACLSIVNGAVAGDNAKLYAEDGTWLTWNTESEACFIYSEAVCDELSDEDSSDNSFQYCGLT